ncbi:membrane protein, putative [invertebrate metagenome]|uniref:Membrane protein, putative n=1 Tax=invertebrate metagenome TaxID=1711999 RepID=A0A484HB17_9ZZZZ
MKTVHFNLLVRGLVLITTLACAGWLFKASDQATVWIDTVVRDNGLVGEILFVSVGALFTALGLPRQTICFLGGYAFGLFEGSLLALLASVGGCISGFVYARKLGRSVVFARFPEKIRHADALLQRNPFAMALLIRLLPVGSNLFTNLVAGISGVQMLAFVAGSTLGYVPQTVIFALLGSGIQIHQIARVGLSILLFVFSSLIGIWILLHRGCLPPPQR